MNSVSVFLRYKLRLPPFIYRLIDAALIGNFFDDPFLFKIWNFEQIKTLVFLEFVLDRGELNLLETHLPGTQEWFQLYARSTSVINYCQQ